MSQIFEAADKKLELKLEADQLGFLDGLALAARFKGIDYKITPSHDLFSDIKEVEDNKNVGFLKGWRFSLVSAGKYRVYWTGDAYTWKGAQTFAESFLGQSKDSFVTDVIDFNLNEGGTTVLTTGEVDRKIFALADNTRYLLIYRTSAPGSSGSSAAGTTFGGQIGLYSQADATSDYESVIVIPLVDAMKDRDFLDLVRGDISDTLYYFFTKALLTTLAGLPEKIEVKTDDSSATVNGLKISLSELKSNFFAEYMSHILKLTDKTAFA